MKSPNERSRPNGLLRIVLLGYVALWLLLALRPVDRSDWFLENLLVFVVATVLMATRGRFQFSNRSYLLIVFFLAIHAIGAHYTYAKVPAGFWLQDWLHLERNHYDRVIHFSFGFLLVYPMRELLRRSAGPQGAWAIGLAIAALAALSSFFEVVEAIIAQLVHPELGAAYLGTQGDMWDAQKDMTAAFLGAVVAAVLIVFVRPTRDRSRG